jgi:hypothetical protein
MEGDVSCRIYDLLINTTLFVTENLYILKRLLFHFLLKMICVAIIIDHLFISLTICTCKSSLLFTLGDCYSPFFKQ